jgi:hypothetical protein
MPKISYLPSYYQDLDSIASYITNKPDAPALLGVIFPHRLIAVLFRIGVHIQDQDADKAPRLGMDRLNRACFGNRLSILKLGENPAGSGVGSHNNSLGKRDSAAYTAGKVRNLYGISSLALIENCGICEFHHLPPMPACFRMDLIITGAISPK